MTKASKNLRSWHARFSGSAKTSGLTESANSTSTSFASRAKASLSNPLYFGISLVTLALILVGVVILIVSVNSGESHDEAYFAAASEEIGEKEREDYPILAYLPVKNALFTLGYQLSTDNQLVVKITTTETYLDDAVTKLLSFGVDLSETNIEIVAPENPFLSAYVLNSASDPLTALRVAYAKIENFQVLHLEAIDADGNFYDTSDASAFATDSRLAFIFAKISAGSAETYSFQTYRVILKKENNQFVPVSNPAPILTTFNTPGVPTKALSAANKL